MLDEEQMEKNTYLYIKVNTDQAYCYHLVSFFLKPEADQKIPSAQTLTEKRSFEVAKELGVNLSSIVPSFVIGPVISDQLGFSPFVVKVLAPPPRPLSALAEDLATVQSHHLEC